MSGLALRCARHHSGAKGHAKLVLLEYAGYPEPYGPRGVWARNKRIADGCGVSLHTLQRAKKTLAAAGLIKVEPQAGQHGTDRVIVLLCSLCASRAPKGDDGDGPLAGEGVPDRQPPLRSSQAPPGVPDRHTRLVSSGSSEVSSPTHPEELQPPLEPPAASKEQQARRGAEGGPGNWHEEFVTLRDELTNELPPGEPPELAGKVASKALAAERRTGPDGGPAGRARYLAAVREDWAARAMVAERARLHSGESSPGYRPFVPTWAEGGPPLGADPDQEAAG